MFVNKVSTLNKRLIDIFDTVDGTDLFNSKFIYELDKQQPGIYLINSSEGRLDLISESNLGNKDNYGINYVYNRITDNSELKLGKFIKLLKDLDVFALKNSL